VCLQIPGSNAVKRRQNAMKMIKTESLALQDYANGDKYSNGAVSSWWNLLLVCAVTDPLLAPHRHDKLRALWRDGATSKNATASKAGGGKTEVLAP